MTWQEAAQRLQSQGKNVSPQTIMELMNSDPSSAFDPSGALGGAQNSAASIPGAPGAGIGLGSELGAIGGELGGIFGEKNNVSNTGVAQGVNQGLDFASMIPGPWQPFAMGAAALAPFVESFIGQGVPRNAKTAAIGTALGNSGDPLAALLGQYVGQGAQGGHVFSESGPTTFGGATDQVAAMLEALTGQQIHGVTGTGTDFSKNPTYTPGALGRVGTNLELPQGFEFVNDPSKYPQILKDIEKLVPMGGSLAGAPGVKQEEGRWKDLLSQLQSQGILQRYQGSLGAPGAGGGTPGQGGVGSAGPGVALPHPLANQQNNNKFATSPYPLTAGA